CTCSCDCRYTSALCYCDIDVYYHSRFDHRSNSSCLYWSDLVAVCCRIRCRSGFWCIHRGKHRTQNQGKRDQDDIRRSPPVYCGPDVPAESPDGSIGIRGLLLKIIEKS